jgi:isopentenyl-diphosphate delta-isomerase
MELSDWVVLVDEHNNEVGLSDKMEAHRKGFLHWAVSVFVLNSRGEWLLQQRAADKYHSNSLWTNTCCTHPYKNESNIEAANRRLLEEMGMTCDLIELFSFLYKEQLDNELTEHELDCVFVGCTDDLPTINKKEVMNYTYICYEELKKDIDLHPQHYTVWFKMIVEKVQEHISLLATL